MLDDYLTATGGHLLNAVFLGLVPVLAIALLVALIVGLVVRVALVPHALNLFGFALFFGAVGASLGVMLGASREPAVGAYLPAIVAALSGLFVYLFPRDVERGVMTLLDDAAPGEAPAFLRSFLLVGVAAMMLSSSMGAFYGGSVRGLKEEGARDYAEWLLHYETLTLPLKLENIRRQAGWTDPPAADE
ncbi:hypothetical protein DXV76_02630 [Rhodobacteraceae bacterium CCMM004]|nr:hypothetical protein DXV76_02630 [Rhodobacteraceae bacterium CCMM004]